MPTSMKPSWASSKVHSLTRDKSAPHVRESSSSNRYESNLKSVSKGQWKALAVGVSDDPSTVCGPVIDDVSAKRVRKAVKLASEELETLVSVKVTQLAKEGHFVAPIVFSDVPADDPIAQTELFAPVLTIHPVKTFDEALAIANDHRVRTHRWRLQSFARKPENRRVVSFRVGNLYLNRPITGALVGRQPFGGFRFSGIGTKAGGEDYLKQFVVPTTVTENTMRRGFTPPDED